MTPGRLMDAITCGPARRRRRIRRALARLDRIDARADALRVRSGGPPPGPRDWTPAAPLRARRRGRGRPGAQLLAWTVVAAALLTPILLPHLLPARSATDPSVAVPPAGVGATHGRLLRTVAPPAGRGGYRFLRTQPHSRRPVTYDPCRPIHYVVRLDGAPASTRALIAAAVAEVSAATGLRLVYDGDTTEAPRDDRDGYQPRRYGRRWAPVLVAWTSPTEYPGLAGRPVGRAGSRAWPDTHGHLTYVSGVVALDGPALLPDLDRPGGAARVRAVIMHELGHVVGLAHVRDGDQLMYAENRGQTRFGDGDLRGLASLGAGQCVPGL